MSTNQLQKSLKSWLGRVVVSKSSSFAHVIQATHEPLAADITKDLVRIVFIDRPLVLSQKFTQSLQTGVPALVEVFLTFLTPSKTRKRKHGSPLYPFTTFYPAAIDWQRTLVPEEAIHCTQRCSAALTPSFRLVVVPKVAVKRTILYCFGDVFRVYVLRSG